MIAVLFAPACARDGEAELRARLSAWFYLGDTIYFRSRMRCTGAMLHVTVDRPRPALAVQDHPQRASEALRLDGMAAVRMEDMTPADLTAAMRTSGTGTFGRQAVATGALAGPCFEDSKIGALLFEALNRRGATLAYDGASDALIVLDPARRRLFYVAGDAW